MSATTIASGPDPGIPKNPDYFSNGGATPYISDSDLWWYTWFGLNHFAVNEPLWGLAKLMTAGGIGLWYLWDVMFISFNGDFVQKNGFPTPFHILGKRLFGQGAISKGPAPFKQQSSYGLWALSTFLAPFGLQALFEQNFPLFLRNIMNLVVIITVMYVIYSYTYVRGLDALYWFELIWLMIVGFVFLTYSPMILLPWYNTVKVAFDPEAVMKNGIPFTSELDGYTNSFKDPVKHVNTQENANEINTKWAIGGSNKEYIRSLFTPKTEDEIAQLIAAKTAAVATSKKTNAWDVAYLAIISPWLNSFLEMGAGIFEFFAARYGVSVDKIKSALKNGIDPATATATATATAMPTLPVMQGVTVYPKRPDAVAVAEATAKQFLGKGTAVGVRKNSEDLKKLVADAAMKRSGITQGGGARSDEESLSTESLVLGGTVITILGAGALKLAISYLMPS